MPRRKRRTSSLARNAPISALTPARMALLLALTAAPAIFNIQSGTSFEPDKAVVIIALAAVALIDAFWRSWQEMTHRVSRIAHHPWALLLAALAAWAAVITLTSVNPVVSLWGNYERGYGLLTLLAGLTFFVIAREMTRSGQAWLLVDAALLGAVIPLLYGFIQMLTLDPVRGFGVSFPLGERASSTLGNPLYLGDYLLMILLLAGARRVLHPPARSANRRILEIFGLSAAGLLILTFSRSAYLGTLAAAATLLIFLGIQQRSKARQNASSLRSPHNTGPNSVFGSKWLLPAGLIALIIGALTLMLLWPRLQHGGTIQQRLLIWQAVMDLLRSQPRALLMGLGFDTLALRLAPYLSPTLGHFEPDFIFRIPDRAHSLSLDLLTTGGLPWMLGWLALGGMALWHLVHSRHSLAPWLAAIILGRGVLLLVSFPTHIPDILFWSILGASFGLKTDAAPSGATPVSAAYLPLSIAAFGVFGFSLSAAWPGGLFLWLLSALPLALMLVALSPSRPLVHSLLRPLAFILLILPAILLNQYIGPVAQLAWVWLLLWLAGMAIFAFAATSDLTVHILQFTATALLLLLITIPRLGDIAYKSALLASDEPHRQRYFARALNLSPHDDVMQAGMAWVLAQQPGASVNAQSPAARRITALYESALRPSSHPRPPEIMAAYARWLAQLAKDNPEIAPQALKAFDAALTRSPHDIQTLNDRAMLLAGMGRSDEAIAELQRLLTLDPLYGPTYLNLAQVYRQIGDDDAARAAVEQGKQNVPWWDAWEN